jgi:eukaryotic-like serine/threonine-protein kinase
MCPPYCSDKILEVRLTAFWLVWPAPPAPRIARFTIAPPADQQFTNAGRQLVAISPDGSLMVYVANQQLYRRSMSDTEAKPIQGTAVGPVLNPVFLPDGRSIAFYQDQTIKRIAVTGGTAVTICQAGRCMA